MAVVEGELVFAEVEGELAGGDAVGLAGPALGEAPEAPDAVDVAGAVRDGPATDLSPIELEVAEPERFAGDKSVCGRGGLAHESLVPAR